MSVNASLLFVLESLMIVNAGLLFVREALMVVYKISLLVQELLMVVNNFLLTGKISCVFPCGFSLATDGN